MVKRVFAYSILAFWAVMAAWFARREIIPKLYAQPIHRYAVLRPYAETHPGYRMGIFAPDGSTRLGYTETTYHPKDDGHCEIASNTVVNLRKHTLVARLGPMRDLFKKIEISSNVTIGPDNRLKTFRMACDAVQGFAFGAVRGNSMEVIVNFQGHQWKRIVPVTDEDVMSSGYMAVGALPALRVGQAWRINVLDPLTFKFTTAMARVTKRTRIQLRGHW